MQLHLIIKSLATLRLSVPYERQRNDPSIAENSIIRPDRERSSALERIQLVWPHFDMFNTIDPSRSVAIFFLP